MGSGSSATDGRPLACHAGSPPSRTLEFVCPNARNMKSARGALNIP